ncbi:MAG: UV damage repair protein UvrX [Bacillota bacterium]
MEINYAQLPDNKILCVDIKSFFASVEAVDLGWDPMQVCLVVVGDQNRDGAVVLASSPLMKKKYNIRTGNRLFEVPQSSDIHIVDARMGLYLKRSLEITLLFKKFVPLNAIHVYSIDESWLNLNGTERLYGNTYKAAEKIKDELKKRFGLASSMGIGPNMFLAKVAMDIEGKKNGLTQWTYDDIKEKLWPIPVKECWGIGRKLSGWFNKIGVNTVGDVANLPLEFLEDKFGILGNQLYYQAWGVDLSKLEGHYKDRHKALGRGITLFKDYTDYNEIKTVIFELSEEVAWRARNKNLIGKTIVLGIGYSKSEKKPGFHVQRTRQEYTNLASEVFQIALQLFGENYKGEAVRKVSVALGNLSGASSMKLNLFEDKLIEINLSEVKDAIEDRYGYQALFTGRSLRTGSVRERIKTTIGGHGK